MQDDAYEIDGDRPYASPLRQRQRITKPLRAAVIEAYKSGKTSREVAEAFAIGQTTVLKILKAGGVTVRPQGRRY